MVRYQPSFADLLEEKLQKAERNFYSAPSSHGPSKATATFSPLANPLFWASESGPKMATHVSIIPPFGEGGLPREKLSPQELSQLLAFESAVEKTFARISLALVKSEWREAAFRLHPDHNLAPDAATKFIAAHSAYTQLKQILREKFLG